MSDTTLLEGDSGSSEMLFTVTRTGDLSVAVSVGYTTADGTATAGLDYTAKSGTLNFAAGVASLQVSVPVLGDVTDEADEIFTLKLVGPVVGGGQSLTLTDRQPFATQVAPVALAATDLNADGRPDLVVANRDSTTISVYLNTTAAGATTLTFGTRQDIVTGSEPHAVAAGDLNADGKPDLAVVNRTSQTITVLLNATAAGATTATFADALDLQSFLPRSVAIGDLNFDGKPELVVASETYDELTVYVNLTPDGGTVAAFGAPRYFYYDFFNTYGPVRVLVADVNGDNQNDVLTANSADGSVSVFLNDTSNLGSTSVAFLDHQTFGVRANPADLGVGDVNGDGKPDFVASSFDTNTISVLLNTTDAGSVIVSTATRKDFDVGVAPRGVRLADLDGDGRPEVVVTNSNTVVTPNPADDTISVFGNLTADRATTPAFTARKDFAAGRGAIDSVVADFNRDGLPDVAVADRFVDTLSVYLQTGYVIQDAAGVGTITDDDLTPAVSISDVALAEGNGGPTPFTFTVSLNVANKQTTSVSFSTLAGTATTGSDFAETAGSVTFAPGETSKTVTVVVNGDTAVEPDERFVVKLSSPVNGTLADGDAEGTILNDDTPAVITVTPPATADEGAAVVLDGSFAIPGGALNGPFTFTWSVTGPAGTVLTSSTGTVATPGGVPAFQFTPADDGSYTASLTVVDREGDRATRTAVVAVRNVAPVVTSLIAPAVGVGGKPVAAFATATDPAGVNDPLTYAWQVTREGVAVASGTGPALTFTPPGGGSYTLAVTVADPDGGTTTATRTVQIAPPPQLLTTVGTVVRVRNPIDGSIRSLTPFPGFGGSVSTATADLNGDGVPDIVAGAGPGGGPHVKAFDGRDLTELASFYAYQPTFTGGVFVAAANGRIATGAGQGGGPHVRTFDARGVEQSSFYAYDESFTGGVRVAFADVTGDGVADVVTGAGPGGPPTVKVFAGGLPVESARFLAFDKTFAGGVFVAATTGRIAAGAGAGGTTRVNLFDGTGTATGGVEAFISTFTGGVRVGFADADGDGLIDLLAAAGPGGGPHVRAFRLPSLTEVASFYAADRLDPRGVWAS